MLEKLKEYFEREYKSTKRYLETLTTKAQKKHAVDITIHEMIGACTIIQFIDKILTFAEIDALYDEYRKKMKKLLD